MRQGCVDVKKYTEFLSQGISLSQKALGKIFGQAQLNIVFFRMVTLTMEHIVPIYFPKQR